MTDVHLTDEHFFYQKDWRKMRQNAAFRIQQGENLCKLKYFSSATAKVVIDERNFAHRGKMRQIVPEHGSRDIPFVYVSED